MEMIREKTKLCPTCGNTIAVEAVECPNCQAKFAVTYKGYCATEYAIQESDSKGICLQCGKTVIDFYAESALVKAGNLPAPSVQPSGAAKAGRLISQGKAAAPEDAVQWVIEPIRGEGVNLRFSGVFVDMILIDLIYSLIAVVVIGVSSIGSRSVNDFGSLYSGTIIALIPTVWLLYFILFEGISGATPGKRGSSLKVIRKDGGKIKWWQAAIRAVLGIFEYNPIGAIFVWATPLKQRIGDLLAGTLVVNRDKIYKVEFRPKLTTLDFHDYRHVEFATITEGVIHKFGFARQVTVNGVSPQGGPVTVQWSAQFQRREVERIRREIERRYQIAFSEKIILWRLIMVIMVLLIGVSAIVLAISSLPKRQIPLQSQPITFSTATPKPLPTRPAAPTSTPLPVEITFDTIGNYPKGRMVILVGRLALMRSTKCSIGECGLLLENPSNPQQTMTIFVTVGSEPNQMKPLPNPYTKSDIQVRLDDGTFAVVGYRIRVTGKVCSTTSNEPCISDIVKIELYQVK